MMRKLPLHLIAAALCASAAVDHAYMVLAAEPAAPGRQDAYAAVAGNHDSRRTVISLDGTWQIAEGKMEQAPASFDRSVPVPGLVSLATPAFDAPGPKVAKREGLPQKDPNAMPSGIGGRSRSTARCRPWRGSRLPRPCSARGSS